MKKILFGFLLAISFATVQAQQDYKALLDSFYQHSENGFKDIIGEQTDTLSVFYPSKLTADIGEVKIGKYPYTVTLNWIIPLAQSERIQTDVQHFISTTFADDKNYRVISDGTDEENYKTTNVYVTQPFRKTQTHLPNHLL